MCIKTNYIKVVNDDNKLETSVLCLFLLSYLLHVYVHLTLLLITNIYPYNKISHYLCLLILLSSLQPSFIYYLINSSTLFILTVHNQFREMRFLNTHWAAEVFIKYSENKQTNSKANMWLNKSHTGYFLRAHGAVWALACGACVCVCVCIQLGLI